MIIMPKYIISKDINYYIYLVINNIKSIRREGIVKIERCGIFLAEKAHFPVKECPVSQMIQVLNMASSV